MFTESLNNKWKIPGLIPEGNTNPVRVASGVEICQFKHGAACCGRPSWIRVQLKVAAASIGMGMYALTENNAEYVGNELHMAQFVFVLAGFTGAEHLCSYINLVYF